MADDVTALDATFLELEEADESAHMHIGGVLVFEPAEGAEAPALSVVQAETLARLDDMPRYRRRLSEPHTGGIHWPEWVEDESFDIRRHVFAAGLPEPRGEEQLLDWAGDYFSQRLERSRPLWEMVQIELADGRWAIVTKTHHSMVDGVGSVELANSLFDVEPGSHARASDDALPPGPEHPRSRTADASVLNPMRLAGGAVGTGARVAGAGVSAARSVVRAVSAPLRDPGSVRDALHRSRALADVLVKDELVAAPQTSLNDPIGTRRRLAVLTVPLAELKGIKNSLGGTVNDVVLAASAGGFRSLLESRGETPPEQGLRAMVPVNLRDAGERLSMGNKITSLFVHLPVAVADPLARYEHQVDEAERLKSGSQGAGSRTMIDVAGHAPPVIHSFVARGLFATRLFNVTVTNVPGPQVPLYAFGSRMVAIYPLVPIAASHAVGLAVLSYDGRLFFCLNSDRDSMPDLEVLARGIRESLDELTRLAGAANGGRHDGTPESVITAE